MNIKTSFAAAVVLGSAVYAAPVHATASPAADGDVPAPRLELWDGVRPVDPARLRTPADVGGDAGTPPATAGGVPITDITVDQDPEGDAPREVTWLPDGSAFLVVNRDTDNLTIHDRDTGLATAAVPVGDGPVSVAVTPDGTRAVTADLLGNSLTVVDIASASAVATIPVSGAQPFRVRITADGSRAVAGVINTGPDSIFSIIDLTTLTEVATVPVGGMGAIGFSVNIENREFKNFFTDFAISSGGVAVMYFRSDDLVRLVDVATATVIAETPVGDLPDSVDVSPLGDLAVVGCQGDDALVTIDLSTGTLVGFLPVPDLSDRLVRFTPNGQEIVCWSGNFVTFVDAASGAFEGAVDHGSFTVSDLEFTGDGQTLLVGSANLRVIDVATRSLVTSILVPGTEEIAASPADPRDVVGLKNVFGQTIHRYRINGSASTFLGEVAAGVPDEGDNPFAVAWSPDGTRLFVGNVISGNVTVVDPVAGASVQWLPGGARVREVRISPDGSIGMATASDANRAFFFDPATGADLGSVTINSRPGPARFSPDSTEAYVLNISGTDQVTWIDLTGPAPQIVAQVPAGQAGAANGPLFTEWSGMELSPDGSVLAVCDSFNDLVRLYDTATRQQVAALPTGDFPLQVAFGPGSDRAYVLDHFGDSLTVIDVAGAASTVVGTVTGLDESPLAIVVDDDDRHVYVGTSSGSSGGAQALRVVDTIALDIVASIPLAAGSIRSMVREAGGELIAGTTDQKLAIFQPAGPGTAAVAVYDLPWASRQVAFDPISRSVAVASPFADVVTIVDLPGGTTPIPCPGDADGSEVVDFGDVLLVLGNFGLSGGPADVDGSGTVDFGDVLLVLGNFGPC